MNYRIYMPSKGRNTRRSKKNKRPLPGFGEQPRQPGKAVLLEQVCVHNFGPSIHKIIKELFIGIFCSIYFGYRS